MTKCITENEQFRVKFTRDYSMVVADRVVYFQDEHNIRISSPTAREAIELLRDQFPGEVHVQEFIYLS